MAESNFAFLQPDWPDLFAEAQRAERLTLLDPRTSCFYARRALEHLVSWLFEAEQRLKPAYRDDLSARLHEPSFADLVGHGLRKKMDIVRKQGNNAVHGNRPISGQDSAAVLRELFEVAVWLGRHYARHEVSRPTADIRFDPDLLPRPRTTAPAQQSREELKRREEQLAAKDAALAAERERSTTVDTELARLRAKVAAAKQANESVADEHDYDETATRDHYIDLLLAEAGWSLDGPDDREYPVTGMPTTSGAGRVDYVLWGGDGKPLALVEAKRTTRDATEGRQQAKLYADALENRFGQRPLIYYTNGYQHYFWDDTRYPPREVAGFRTADELALLIRRRATRKPLGEARIDTRIVERAYQHRAIRRIAATFDEDNQRAALVVMATGAGKTRSVIALVDLLLGCNWVKRVLFLADRNALVTQAVNAFKTHLPESSPVNLVEEKHETGARVYVSTYPTMLGLLSAEEGDRRRFGVGFFDLVVVDEAHRSVYQKYRSIFSYFDALLVGLTATPRDEIDRDTYGLFGLERGVPTDAYPLQEAIDDGYLLPYRAVSVPLRIPQRGLRYDELSAEEQARWEALDWGEDDDDMPTEVDAEDVNTWLFNADTVDKVLATLMTRGQKVAGGDRLGKTIVFAKNNNHAEFIAARFDANYPAYRGEFARVITHRTEHAQSLINDFSVADRAPHIAISVDMLDTGIDVPEVVNLAFVKPVRSRTKFAQMIGRGTRLCRDVFGPGRDKAEFFVFDFCRNFEFFGAEPEVTEPRLPVPLGQKLFTARLDLLGALDERGEQGERRLREDTAEELHAVVAGMATGNVEVRPHRWWVATYADRNAWDSVDAEARAGIACHLSGLPSAARDEDEQAKRFDLLMLRIQLCVCNAEPGFTRLRDTVREIAGALLARDNIPAVAQQAELLETLAEEEWWADVSLPMLENARRRVRGLAKLIERARRGVVYTDFADELGEITETPYSGGSTGAGLDMRRFRAKVREFLARHEDNLILHKLRRNQPLTASDLAELERLLAGSGELDEAALRRSVEQARGLGAFIRSLVGLDREAAKAAMSGFLSDTTFNADQIEFVNLIVEHLTHDGAMGMDALYEPPFTGLAPTGPDYVFPAERMRDLEIVLDDIRARALAS
jgi:type I restriction enzyme R subunit